MQIDRSEVLRYMGYRDPGRSLNEARRRELEEKIEAVLPLLEREASPRHVCRIFPLSLSAPEGETPVLQIGPLTVASSGLAKNLRGCTEAAVLAATLGLGPDRLLRQAGQRSLFEMSLLQAAAAAMIEAYTDECNEAIRREAASRGLTARPRFSPGYGDLSLTLQRGIFRVLQLPRTIGLTLTDSLMMVPSKSVTALIGLAPKEGGSHDFTR